LTFKLRFPSYLSDFNSACRPSVLPRQGFSRFRSRVFPAREGAVSLPVSPQRPEISLLSLDFRRHVSLYLPISSPKFAPLCARLYPAGDASAAILRSMLQTSCKDLALSTHLLFHFLRLLDAFGWLTDGFTKSPDSSNSPRSASECSVFGILSLAASKTRIWPESNTPGPPENRSRRVQTRVLKISLCSHFWRWT
jgi:hypothetical protein